MKREEELPLPEDLKRAIWHLRLCKDAYWQLLHSIPKVNSMNIQAVDVFLAAANQNFWTCMETADVLLTRCTEALELQAKVAQILGGKEIPVPRDPDGS